MPFLCFASRPGSARPFLPMCAPPRAPLLQGSGHSRSLDSNCQLPFKQNDTKFLEGQSGSFLCPLHLLSNVLQSLNHLSLLLLSTCRTLRRHGQTSPSLCPGGSYLEGGEQKATSTPSPAGERTNGPPVSEPFVIETENEHLIYPGNSRATS